MFYYLSDGSLIGTQWPMGISGTVLQIGDLGLAFWITIVVAVIAIIIPTLVAAYFYRKSRQFKRPAYTVTTANLIQDYSTTLFGLKIEYKGKNPANISVSKVAVWNDGTDTVQGSDISLVDPLRVVLADGDILDANVVSTTSNANQFSASIVGKDLQVKFDFLDKNHGGIIQLVHTGKSSEAIKLMGTVKGAQPISRRTFEVTKTRERLQILFLLFAMVLLVLVTSIGNFVFGTAYGGWPSLGLAGLAVIIWLRFVFGRFQRMLRGIPPAFESAANIV